jgi:glucose/arabinose dehydrogenase
MLRVSTTFCLVTMAAVTGCAGGDPTDLQEAMSPDTDAGGGNTGASGTGGTAGRAGAGGRGADANDGAIRPEADVSQDSGTTGSDDAVTPPDDSGAHFDPDASYPYFCDLPGSIRYTDTGVVTVPPATAASSGLRGFLKIPRGFCAHHFGNLAALAKGSTPGGNVRQLRFSPSGDLFVASPTAGTTGGGQGGLAAILVLPDDNRDGVADSAIRFAELLPQTQGMLFANDSFYYQDGARILRVPYRPGDRSPSGPSSLVLSTSVYYTSGLHWPKTLDRADDGTIYVANGSDQDEGGSGGTSLGTYCGSSSRPFVGGIIRVDGTTNGTPISKGFRNPIAVRCQRGHNLCFASELAKDYSAGEGGREKLVPIRVGDDWGFPCCATKNVPHVDVSPPGDCSSVTPDEVSFLIGDTPFGFDFERGKWPMPYAGAIFIPLHGAAGTWTGARIVLVTTNPATGSPMPGTSTEGGTSAGAMSDFATGWDDMTRAHGRPATVEFASDGRMFVGNDNNGDIFWVAPLDLPR